MKRPATAVPAQTPYVSCVCRYCGKNVGQYLGRYERVVCSCGLIYWALQPLRNGPFRLFLWPGRTVEEYQRIMGNLSYSPA